MSSYESLKSQTQANDGSGITSTVIGSKTALDVNLAGGTITSVGTFSDNFARIKNKQFKDTETVLYDIPLALTNAFSYVGVAAKGTAQTATSWNIVRTSFDANGNPSADQIALGIAWSARAAGPWS